MFWHCCMAFLTNRYGLIIPNCKQNKSIKRAQNVKNYFLFYENRIFSFSSGFYFLLTVNAWQIYCINTNPFSVSACVSSMRPPSSPIPTLHPVPWLILYRFFKINSCIFCFLFLFSFSLDILRSCTTDQPAGTGQETQEI